jgi:hypothetical protein
VSHLHTNSDRRAVWASMAACLMMIAYHVGSKALRDALFLSEFDVTALPTMVIVASVVSIAAVLGTSRAMMRLTPARLVPVSFAVSAGLQLVVWGLIDALPRLCAVIVYLQSVVLGSLLTSGFWSMLNERFDPRTAKRLVGRIAGAGTLGGMLGGVIAERVAANFSLAGMLPVLAIYHFSCAGLLVAMRRGTGAAATVRAGEEEGASGLEILSRAPYLKTLASLVILGTISAAMIDFVFKSSALAHYGRNEQLMGFFALFYSITGVLTFFVQTGLSGLALSRLGMARTVGTLPFAVSLGGLAALTVAGLATATIARGLEAVFRGSLFRAGYELFYTPMPAREKRAAKAIVDVGFDRMGDAVGSGLVSLLLNLGTGLAQPAILTVAIMVALGGVWVATRLRGAYIDALEHGLRERGGELAAEDAQSSMAMSGFLDALTVVEGTRLAPAPPATAPPVTATSTAILADPVLGEIALLRSGNAERILRFLAENPQPKHYLVAHLVQLLGWDRVSREVTAVLRRIAERHTGQLIDYLVDENTDFAIRRRLPRVLSVVATPRVAAGLLLGLNDRRFEVRYQCGRALAAMTARNPYLKFSPDDIYGAIRREVAVSRPVWEGQRLLDRAEEPETNTPVVDEFLRERTNRSLQHLFTLLALIHPAEPLRIAFHGLHAEDPQLRGTALEYLESILPGDIWTRLWPLLDRPEREQAGEAARSREEVLAELMKASHSVMLRVEELRKKSEESTGSDTATTL